MNKITLSVVTVSLLMIQACADSKLDFSEEPKSSTPVPETSTKPKNVLFIMADDFNHWLPAIGYYDQAITPNINKLANQGVLFADASSASPVCEPSRQALWSGLSPTNTDLDGNSHAFIRDIPGHENVVTMNQFFKDNGYYVYGGGKLYHPGKMGADDTDPNNWSDLYTQGTGAPGGSHYLWQSQADTRGLVKWSGSDAAVEDANDTKLALHFAEKIKNYANSEHSDKPFFFALGLFRPHLPWNAPKQFFDMYNPDDLPLPQGYLANDLDDIPNKNGSHIFAEIKQQNVWKEGIRAYLANMSYADYNVGLILDALEASPYADNTLVVFTGDHGWALGEKEHWGKFALHDQANRTTMIVKDPDAKGNGEISRKVVSMLDLYPTLADAANLAIPAHVNGNSLSPLLAEPNDPNWTKPIVIRYNGTLIIKTNQWRLVDNGNQSQLYDIVNDPNEWTNLYGKLGYETITAELKAELAAWVNAKEDGIPGFDTVGTGDSDTGGEIEPVIVENITDLTAKKFGCSIELSWSDKSGEIAYIIRRKVVGEASYGNLVTVDKDTVKYIDDTVTSGVNYVYQVRPDFADAGKKVSNNPEIVPDPC
ncbi:sulfatase [Catenovulum maritimum]|uniref:Sulfatase N-terminal domain-containing protein n=1 Tax=Catenovulum maritimum TaxID=1513271 RepID=A0A0J8GU68_9ALTE|nr:sulfatase [Catenovulum maritimum]KMT66305.1 hypothetical protein XM47_04760 [Catenovulum maritimum]